MKLKFEDKLCYNKSCRTHGLGKFVRRLLRRLLTHIETDACAHSTISQYAERIKNEMRYCISTHYDLYLKLPHNLLLLATNLSRS